MDLNIEKLKNVKYRNSCIIARCPVCAEQGHDKKGQHLFIDEQGRFSCVIYPGEVGKEHRKRIFALVGIKSGNEKSYSSPHNKMINVKKATRNAGNVIKSDILGHLGRVFITHARKENNIDTIIQRDFKKGVPGVPSIEKELKQASNDIRLEFLQKNINEVNFNEDDKSCIRCGNPRERFC